MHLPLRGEVCEAFVVTRRLALWRVSQHVHRILRVGGPGSGRSLSRQVQQAQSHRGKCSFTCQDSTPLPGCRAARWLLADNITGRQRGGQSEKQE